MARQTWMTTCDKCKHMWNSRVVRPLSCPSCKQYFKNEAKTTARNLDNSTEARAQWLAKHTGEHPICPECNVGPMDLAVVPLDRDYTYANDPEREHSWVGRQCKLCERYFEVTLKDHNPNLLPAEEITKGQIDYYTTEKVYNNERKD